MAIFWNIFLKTFGILASITISIILIIFLIGLVDDKNNDEFIFNSGDKSSSNIIAVIELNGLIIEKNKEYSEFTNPFIISPSEVKTYLENLKKISPKVVIFSINSPGGTVSASKKLYDAINNFKKNNNVEILFHTNELLASGAYWASTSADGIYASYGSIIGSIGVRGPDWFFYDQPKSISTGIFGNKIETKEGIKIFSSSAGKSKDIFNPFRKPKSFELSHLQKIVNEIYDDFVRVVSKERKIETKNIINNIGALIYTPKQAIKLHLIDDEINLDDLIKKTIKIKNYKDYKIIKKYNKKNSILKEILTSNKYKVDTDTAFDCLSLRSSISAILSYQSTGC